MDLSTPQVMGILNVTPDSFYAGSRVQTEDEIVRRCHQIVDEGASMIDVGALKLFCALPGVFVLSYGAHTGFPDSRVPSCSVKIYDKRFIVDFYGHSLSEIIPVNDILVVTLLPFLCDP